VSQPPPDDPEAGPVVVGDLTDSDRETSADDSEPRGPVGRDPPSDRRTIGDPIEKLKNRQVVVHAGGITYRGELLGADEEEIYLRTNTRYVSVRMDRVSQLVDAEEDAKFSAVKQIDPSFYQIDDLDEETDERAPIPGDPVPDDEGE